MDAELADAFETAWRLLGRGAADRRSPMHTPVVASVDTQGRPQARVMVLRAADRGTATLRFHTDARSPKCRELEGAVVAVTLYHPGEAIQLRLAGTARVVTMGEDIDRIWTTASEFARRAYMVEAAPGTPLPGPGSGLPEGVDGRKPEPAELVPARANFAVVRVEVATVDWLHLAQAGHRRALFGHTDGDWTGGWLVP